jgi:hypothetical protein
VIRIKCWRCERDPGGRRGEPVCIFIDDRHPDGSPRIDRVYTCREHASGRLEEALRARERERGFTIE